jgi:hypothetical protein
VTVADSLRTRNLHDIPYFIVLATAAAGVLYGAFLTSHWLRGVGVVGLAMVFGGVFRAVLTDRQAGMLAVRHRPFDVLCYFTFGAGIVIVGIITNRLASG